MKKFVLVSLIVVLVVLLNAQNPSMWTNVRNSSFTQQDSIYIRCETGNNVVNTQMYYSTQSGWGESNLENITGLTYQGSAYFNNQNAVYIRYRSIIDTFVTMQSAFVSTDENTPNYQKLGFVIDDMQNDTATPGTDCLDIESVYFGNSDNKIYAGMKNFVQDYPPNNGGYVPTEFYFYIAGIINPETAWQDTIMYAMIFANVPMVVEPGLYKIHGTDFSPEAIQKIADINYDNGGDALVMSCNIDDLVNDPDFGEWPNMSNSMGYTFFTMRTGISGTVTVSDYSKTSQQIFENYVIEPFENHLPQISDANAVVGVTNTNVTATYTDEDNHFPLTAKAVVHYNGVENEYSLSPAGFDYENGVNFVAQIPETEWDYILISFSDNNSDFSETTIYSQSADDNVVSLSSRTIAYPNPFNLKNAKNTVVSISYDNAYYKNAVCFIYNLKGEKITKIKGNEGKFIWTVSNKMPSGLYFYKLESRDKKKIGKITLIK